MDACCPDDVMMAVKHNGSMHDVMVTMYTQVLYRRPMLMEVPQPICKTNL